MIICPNHDGFNESRAVIYVLVISYYSCSLYVSLFSLSAHLLSCFLDMKLQNVYHTLHIFVQWIEDGYYDFQSLPYATKTHLHVEDELVLQQLQQDYNGTYN